MEELEKILKANPRLKRMCDCTQGNILKVMKLAYNSAVDTCAETAQAYSGIHNEPIVDKQSILKNKI